MFLRKAILPAKSNQGVITDNFKLIKSQLLLLLRET